MESEKVELIRGIFYDLTAVEGYLTMLLEEPDLAKAKSTEFLQKALKENKSAHEKVGNLMKMQLKEEHA